jgi:hypothetical protein
MLLQFYTCRQQQQRRGKRDARAKKHKRTKNDDLKMKLKEHLVNKFKILSARERERERKYALKHPTISNNKKKPFVSIMHVYAR